MALSIKTSVRTDRSTEINNALGAAALVRFYSGSAPTSVNDAATGTLLAECTAHATAFGTVSAGVLTAQDVAGESYVARDASANATGTIGYCRATTSAGVAILQSNDVGVTGSGAEVILPSLAVTSGEAVEVDSFVVTEGNA